jgi:hypothetical protein
LSASAGVAIAKLKDKIPDSKSDIARVMADLLADKAARHAPVDHWSRERAEGSGIDRGFDRRMIAITPNLRS